MKAVCSRREIPDAMCRPQPDTHIAPTPAASHALMSRVLGGSLVLHTLAVGHAALAESNAQSVTGGASSTHRNILIIERIAGASQPWVAILREAGHQVVAGTSKEEA